MSNRKNICAYILSAILVFILIYIPAYYIPFHSDDYSYFLKGLSFEAHRLQYFNWSGRFITDYTSSLLLNLFSKPVYMAINSLAFLVMLINVSFLPSLIDGRVLLTKKNYIILWLSFLLYWLCNPNLGQTSFWLVGSANYLWPLMWLSLYLVVLFKLISGEATRLLESNNLKLVVLCILGFLTGLSNEGTAAATVFLTSMLLLINWINSRSAVSKDFLLRISCKDSFNCKIILVGLLSSLTGFLVLVLAPGNYIRMSHEAFVHWRSLPLVYKVLGHVVMRMPDAISQFWFAFIIVSVLIITLSLHISGYKKLKIQCYIIAATFLTISGISIFWLDRIRYESSVCIFLLLVFAVVVIAVFLNTSFSVLKDTGNNSIRNLFPAFLFFITAMFSLFVFVASPHMPPRVFNTFNFFILLAIVILVNAVFGQSSENGKCSYLIGVIFLLCIPYFLFSYTRFTYAMIQTDVQAKIRDELIYQAKDQNRDEVKIPDWYFTKLTKEHDKFDLWRSESMPQYYGIKKIVWKPVNFNYAILKTKQPLIENAQLAGNGKMRLFYNDSYMFFDDLCLVFEFEEPLAFPYDNYSKIQFHFYQKGEKEYRSVAINEDDFCQFGNCCYFVVRIKDIGFKDIGKIKGIDVMVNSEKITLLRQ